MSDQIQQPVFKCFVIMPFTDTEHVENGNKVQISACEWNFIYERWVKKAVESFQLHSFECSRSLALPGNFIKGIVKDLYEADLVIADLTGSRPNVYYELGIRHALEPWTVMITQDLGSVPSDLRSYYCFKYDYGKEVHLFENRYKAFAEQLHEKMTHFFQNTGVSDNPVSDFIGYKNAFLEERFTNEKSELLFLAENLRVLATENYTICEEFLKLCKNPDHPIEIPLFFDFVPFDALLSRFISSRWELLPRDFLHQFYKLIQMVRRTFLPVYQDWQTIRINQDSFVTNTFLELIEAVVSEREEQQKFLNELIALLETLPFTVSHNPKSVTAKAG